MPYSGKKATKYTILNYMLNHGDTSKVEPAKQLNLSMPTVLSNVNELMETGLVTEKGELESTGGRKAVLYYASLKFTVKNNVARYITLKRLLVTVNVMDVQYNKKKV